MTAHEFREAIIQAGLLPPAIIEPGKIHRIAGNGKGPANRAGWCLLFPDGRGGIFGDWSSGLYQKWRAFHADGKPISAAERKAFARLCRQAAAERKRIDEAEQLVAAQNAAKIYAAASKANPAHAYLIRKGVIAPPLLRQSGGPLLIPMTDAISGNLRGLQNISADGQKRFTAGMSVNGCIFSFAGANDGPLVICEGFATAASIAAATAWQVVCSFSSSNLPHVARLLRQQHPQRRILIAADNDHEIERAGRGNAGLEAGRKAAKAVGGTLVAPPPHAGTDWNDFFQAHGAKKLDDVLRTALASVSTAVETKAVTHA